MADNATFNAGAVRDMPVPPIGKGLPFDHPLRIGEIGGLGWSLLADVPLPAASIHASVIAANSRWMADYLGHHGALLAPHIKTTMAPQLIERQIADGAWALTVATWHQAALCRSFGARRIILANQLVGHAELDAVVRALNADADLELYFLVDSMAGLQRFEEAARRGMLARTASVLVEIGYAGGRTGVRDAAAAIELMHAIKASPYVILAGLELFEGLLQSRTDEQVHDDVRALLRRLGTLLAEARGSGLIEREPAIITAGGSSFYPEVVGELARLDAQLVVRSGCYLIHDHGLYARSHDRVVDGLDLRSGLRPALEVWGSVQSIPEPGFAIVSAGKRDLGHDAGAPLPIKVASSGCAIRDLGHGWQTTALSDHHAHVRFPAEFELAVGDRLAFGVSHPCTTIDKWPLLYLIDDGYRIVDAIKTFF